MGKNNYFKFKQFSIKQERSAMKVGTDGILLGSWTDVKNCTRMLDIGTGTGLIALMLAQRTNSKIAGIEIEKNAAVEAKQNVANSPWSEQVEIQHIALQEFADKQTSVFDLIVSNPPFFSNALKAGNKNRTFARHNDSLPFFELLSCSSKLLTSAGKLVVILPFDSVQVFERLASTVGLFLIRKTEIKPNPQKPVNRVLLEFSKIKTTLKEDCLTIYIDKGIEYSEAFKKLTKAFYLNF